MSEPSKESAVVLEGPAPGSEASFAVIGCGGTGCNVLAERAVDIRGRSMAIGSEQEVLDALRADHKFRAEPRRLEAEARSVMSSTRLAGTELEAGLAKALKGVDLAFVVAGLGGNTGGWAAVTAARACKLARCLSLCLVSEPFKVEGHARAERAKEQSRLIIDYADGLVIMPNDMILNEAPNLPIMRAFQVMNTVLARPANLLATAVGKDDLAALRLCLSSAKIFAMDVVEWEGEQAPFALAERLAASRWLSLQDRSASSAILLAEGDFLHDDLMELGRGFDRKAGPVKHLLLARVGGGNGTFRVTALVGF